MYPSSNLLIAFLLSLAITAQEVTDTSPTITTSPIPSQPRTSDEVKHSSARAEKSGTQTAAYLSDTLDLFSTQYDALPSAAAQQSQINAISGSNQGAAAFLGFFSNDIKATSPQAPKDKLSVTGRSASVSVSVNSTFSAALRSGSPPVNASKTSLETTTVQVVTVFSSSGSAALTSTPAAAAPSPSKASEANREGHGGLRMVLLGIAVGVGGVMGLL